MSGLRSDNTHRAVNQFLLFMLRRGETASGKRRLRELLAVQAGFDRKRREAEVPKSRPVEGLQTEKGANERAGDSAKQ